MFVIALFFLLFVSPVFASAPIDLNTVTIEASRSNDTLRAINKNVTIITEDDIAKFPGKSLSELLGSVPGIYGIQPTNKKHQQVDMGGFGEESASNVLFLVDGRRLNSPDLSGADLSQIDLNSVDHIEIIHGSATVLYGDNAVGGVVNIITKKGQRDAKPSVILSSEWGSYQANKQGLGLSGGLSKLTYQFNYSREQSNGYRSNSNYWANDYNTRLGYEATDVFSIDLAQGYHLDRYRLPGGLSINQINQQGRTAVASFNSTNYGTTSDMHFDVTPRLRFEMGTSNGEFSLFTSARKRDSNIFYFDPSSSETASYEFQPKVIVSTPLTDRLGNKITGGYDYFYNKNKRRFNTPEDIVYSSKITQDVYLLDELTLDERWLLNAGARGSWADYVFDQKQAVQMKFKRSETIQGYDGGIGYKYNPDSKVYFNYSRSYRLPNLEEFFQSSYYFLGTFFPSQLNPSLGPQKGNEYKIGIKDQSFKDIKLGLNFTAAQYKDEIIVNSIGTLANNNYNARTRHYSEEAEASVLLFNKKIEPFASITFQQANYRGGQFSGNEIPFVPNYLAHAGVTYHALERLNTTLSVDSVGKRFSMGDSTNTQPKLKRYATLDWSADYGYKNIEVWVSLRNLLDSKYFTLGSYGAYYPAPGRNVTAGVKVKF